MKAHNNNNNNSITTYNNNIMLKMAHRPMNYEPFLKF